MKSIIVLFLVIAFGSTSPAQNFWQQTAGPGAGSVIAFGKGTGSTVLAATNTEVYRSTNFGAEWLPLSKTFDLTNSDVLSSDTSGRIFIADTYGLYESTDNGSSWQPIGASLSGNTFNGITVSAHDIVFVGTYANGVYRSIDHGATWTQSKNGLPTEPGIGDLYSIDGLYSAPNGSVFALTTGGLARTTNDGNSWQIVGGAAIPSTIVSLAASSTGRLFLTTTLGLLSSDDNGDTWINLSNKNGLATTLAWKVATDGGQTILMSAIEGLWISSDNGASWNSSRPPQVYDEDQALYLDSNAVHIYDGMQYSGIYYSNDKGASWVARSLGLIDTKISSLATDGLGNLFAQGVSSTYGNAIYGTSNLGDTWDTLMTGSDFRAVAAAPNNDLYTCAYGDGIYRSSDHGASWQKETSLPGLYKDKPSTLTVTPSGVVFAGGDNGVIYRSDKPGVWSIKVSGLTSSPITMLGANKTSDVFAANADGLFRTTNNGASWEQLSGAPGGVVAFAADSSGNIYVVTEASAVHLSTNNGDSWNPTGLSGASAIAVNNVGTVYAVGTFGTKYSNDHGSTWTTNSELSAYSPTQLIVHNSERLIAGTNANGVFRSLPTAASGVGSQSSVAGLVFIEDNYPNPFSQKTTIRYSLSRPGMVTVEIYDNCGKKITTLCHIYELQGEHDIIFDAASLRLASGIYNCRIECDGVAATKSVDYLEFR
ncbi:MAG: T9SS type A sorting domain-containing protein [Bacteroidota bacterium]|nr:T9SS type A sorting domain-containing protein [Bacteroidota bacterium]MDP4229891.1 T9SS type A sorting domain-containing protein [Bacteroidota bacterium]